MIPRPPIRAPSSAVVPWFAAALAAAALPGAAQAQCNATTTAEVVAFDRFIWYNRLGAHDPAAMMYALLDDVEPKSGGTLSPGNVDLRDGKRPRPIALRVNEGDCLQIVFTNYLDPNFSGDGVDPLTSLQGNGNTTGTRAASIHVMGMQLVNSTLDDGSNVGLNSVNEPGPSGFNGLVDPGQTITYTLYAEKEGTYLMHSTAQTTGGDGDGGQIAKGLFGAVNVEPVGAEYYRSQVTREDLDLATVRDTAGQPVLTPGGQPVIDYDAVYPGGHPLAGRPILRMTDANGHLVHTDLTAIITGPNRGPFGGGVFPTVEVLRERTRPFREMTIIFHDETGLVQAFDSLYESRRFEHTLHSGRDAFAINYGTGGIGSEILANRFGLGPMGDCTECKYEEFFLTSWAVGDPAMNVDVPAAVNFDPNNPPAPGPQATKAFWPDDPSNVYHSYMNDHMKIRNLHAGPKEHHIFHLHAHQWLHTPDSDNSTYLDSQAIGPGGGYTYEITYDGGSNRNKTPGDAIFHCHFYPHFAQGMWSLWRVHDVFEPGTPLDANGRPQASLPAWQTRALPDGEIAAGTPTPAVVPLPTYSLAPMPTDSMPGFPFYIPGEAGHRPPRPPLDVAVDSATGDTLHGGLPRHVVLDGVADFPVLNTTDFHKESLELDVRWLGEGGEPAEQRAMAFHAQAWQPSFRFDPNSGAVQVDSFRTNGLPPTPGAPYAEPCVSDRGTAPDTLRSIVYKAASFQTDVIYNKAGWHFPQHRMFALWADVLPTMTAQRPPEPMFFRANTNDCITYHLVNLIPFEYAMDDFQVRTPTDVIGQHIHLVKFDVTSSDGAANGFNYEDGSLSPDEVRERIHAIRTFNGCTGDLSGDPRDGTQTCPTPKAHPFFGATGPNGEDWTGAMETIQRWLADNVLNVQGEDRTLRTIFTHDHFSPSTHQQAGLYAGLVAEPKNSTWWHNEQNVQFGTRFDGGPTSWQARIIPPAPDSAYREFNVQVADFSLAYTDAHQGLGPNPAEAVNPPGKFEPNPILPDLLRPPVARNACPNDSLPPCPEVISADDPGTMLVNYRNEPLALRVRNPGSNTQATGEAGDLSLAFASNVTRADADFNVQPNFYPALTNDVQNGDPFTPLMRAYEDDRVQVRILVGAHEEGHNFSVHGMEWLFEPSDTTSGFRASQGMGISEHFEFVLPPLPSNTIGSFADYLYQSGSASDDLWNGLWGILRAYRSTQNDLPTLAYNTDGADALIIEQTATTASTGEPQTLSATPTQTTSASQIGVEIDDSDASFGSDGGYGGGTVVDGSYVDESNASGPGFGGSQGFSGVCPKGSQLRQFDVSAVAAMKALPNGRLVYNPRTVNGGPLHDPTAILYVFTADLNKNGTLKAGVPVEPLVLRARAGDCIELMLRNRLPNNYGDLDGFNTLPMIVDQFNANHVSPSLRVGLHAQLVAHDVTRSDGSVVGFNPPTVVRPKKRVVYQWFAGEVRLDGDSLISFPVEYGAVNLIPSDRIQHPNKGAIAALIIEPRGSTWTTDTGTRLSATVTANGSTFREFVVLYQDDINLRFGSSFAGHASGDPIPNLADAEDAEDSGQKAFNYGTEPLWFRMGHAPDKPLSETRDLDFRDVLENAQVGGDPQTAVFTADAGESVRFRVLQPGGHARNHVFNLHGHAWQEEPYVDGSRRIGDNPLSEVKGTQNTHGPTNHFDALPLHGAGGIFGIPGDYLFRDQPSFLFDGGLWGIFRVAPATINPNPNPNPNPEPDPCFVNGQWVC